MSIHDEVAKTDNTGWMFPTMQISSPEHLSHESVEQTDDLPGKDQQKSQTPFQQSIRRLLRDKRAVISLGIIVFLILLAIVGPSIYQHIGTPYTNDVGQQVGPKVYHNPFWHDLNFEDQPISARYWLGTDSVGADLLARLMQSLLISLSVAAVVEVIDILFGVTIGVLAGYYGGWIDQVLARITDVMFAFPGLLFAVLLTGIFGPASDQYLHRLPLIGQYGNARLILVSIAFALTSWPMMARYVRGQTLQIKASQFIEAARTVGSSDFKIIIRHIVPNLFSVVIVASTLNIAGTIIGEAGISLLGLGVQDPGSSLGLMIAERAEAIETSHPWEVLLPCIVLAIIVLAFSFLGDGLRDAFDPRSKD
jgi:oligopeptide transport system permease protein